MKDSLGRCLKSEIFSAFLSLQTAEGARLAPRAGDALLASAAPAGAARDGRQARAAATQVEVHARREVPAEIVPAAEVASLETGLAQAAERAASSFRFEMLHDPKVLRGTELSIIVPPDADFTAPPRPPARAAKGETRKAAPRVRHSADLERAAMQFAANPVEVLEAFGVSRGEVRLGAETLRRLEVEVEAEGVRTLTKVLKVKRPAPKPAPPPAPAARAQCPREAPAATSRQVSCGPADAQTFYVTE